MPPLPDIKEWQRRIAIYDDEAAYRDLFRLFHKRLQRFSFTFLKSLEQSEEIVSDVFIKVWEKRRDLESIDNLSVYLYVSVKNAALKQLLKEKKLASISIDDLDVELESMHWNPEEILITAEMLQKIEGAIQELPPRCKIIFKLIKEDRLRYKEVASILNISVKTIDNQLALALKKINKAISFDLGKTLR